MDKENLNSREDPGRNFVGYGRTPPDPEWPNGARIAVSFVLNVEEGAEFGLLNGDSRSENYLNERFMAQPKSGLRDHPMETQFDYGSRAGVWRILNLFEKNNVPITLYACGRALEANPLLGPAFEDGGHEVAVHGYRWQDCEEFEGNEVEEKKFVRKGLEAVINTSPTGKPPKGWYLGRPTTKTRALIADVHREMNLPLLWTSDSYGDDLPYWTPMPGGKKSEGLLMVPYSFDCNDFKFHTPPGYTSATDFEEHLKNSFDVLYEEGGKMMTCALHCRIIGRPSRFPALKRFVEYVVGHKDVFVATRGHIAEHWISKFPYNPDELNWARTYSPEERY